MPIAENGAEHRPRLALPEGLAPGESVFKIRFTGEVFKEYRWEGWREGSNHLRPGPARRPAASRVHPGPLDVPLAFEGTAPRARERAITHLIASSSSRSDYLAALEGYRQRIWSCKYTRACGLTYEEAVASEHRVESVTRQVRC